jgi:hypothetical protein
MKRAFWLAAGLGAGVTGAITVSRWMRRQRERLSPGNIGAQVSEGLRDLGELFRDAMAEARAATREREAEIWAEVEAEAEAGD